LRKKGKTIEPTEPTPSPGRQTSIAAIRPVFWRLSRRNHGEDNLKEIMNANTVSRDLALTLITRTQAMAG
jgi:hypothetical protein